jgi:hypothetical protein
MRITGRYRGIATSQRLGYIEDGRLLLLGPQKKADSYRVTGSDGATHPMPPDEDLP